MAINPEDLEPFASRQGPVHVVDENNGAVAYGTSAKLEIRNPGRWDAWTVDQVEIVLLDEQVRPTRSVPGDHILDLLRHDRARPWTDGRHARRLVPRPARL